MIEVSSERPTSLLQDAPSRIDLFLLRYLELVDEYVSLAHRLEEEQRAMHLFIAEADFCAASVAGGERFGIERFPQEKMEASMVIRVEDSSHFVGESGKKEDLKKDECDDGENIEKKGHAGIIDGEVIGNNEGRDTIINENISRPGKDNEEERNTGSESSELESKLDNDFHETLIAMARNLSLSGGGRSDTVIPWYRVVDRHVASIGPQEEKEHDKSFSTSSPSLSRSHSPSEDAIIPSKSKKKSKSMPKDPLFLVSAFPRAGLRRAQVHAVVAARELIPRMASVAAEMRALEIEIRRAKKKRTDRKSVV